MTSFVLHRLLAPIPADDDRRAGARRARPDVDVTTDAAASNDAHGDTYDRDIVARVRAGDAAALSDIHARHWDGLVRYATRITGAPDVATELVQDVFLDIWMRRAEWVVRGSVAAYVYAAVRGRALHVARRDRVTERHAPTVADAAFAAGGMAAAVSPEEEVDVVQLLAIVDAVLAALPPRAREAFLLYREHDLELADVARTMGTSVGTVKVHVRRVVAALRQALAPHLGT